MMRALDLFSGAAGGWTLGLHRAGFLTVAACEIVDWRRILYSENFPNVRLYDDVRTLTAARFVSDFGFLPDIIVGSPPCEDISNANATAKGVTGPRSILYLEAIRLVGECRPRWFAFENSPALRTRGADRLLDELDAIGYACEPCVVGAAHVGANHLRKRSWLIGYDPRQLAANAIEAGRRSPTDPTGYRDRQTLERSEGADRYAQSPSACSSNSDDSRNRPYAQAPTTSGSYARQMGDSSCAGDDAGEPWADWNGGLAHHLRLDDGISAWLAGARITLGSRKGTAAASLIVEAFGDAVVPHIPEAIGRAILRTEAALDVVLGRTAIDVPGSEQ